MWYSVSVAVTEVCAAVVVVVGGRVVVVGATVVVGARVVVGAIVVAVGRLVVVAPEWAALVVEVVGKEDSTVEVEPPAEGRPALVEEGVEAAGEVVVFVRAPAPEL